MLMKTAWYPRVHNFHNAVSIQANVANKNSTIFPIVMYDEGKGSPKNEQTHPENSAFSETDQPNTFPDARINNVFAEMRVGATPSLFGKLDKIPSCRFATMPIFCAFKEDYEALDDLSNFQVKDVLEMQLETSDRQAYPLWNGTNILTKYTASSTYPNSVPGLTAGVMQAVSFDPQAYYDMLHYMTNSGKLGACQGGLRWHTLTPRFPFKNIRFPIPNKSKYQNEYNFFGVLFFYPRPDTEFQTFVTGEVTASNTYLHVDMTVRYNEWHQGFDFERA